MRRGWGWGEFRNASRVAENAPFLGAHVWLLRLGMYSVSDHTVKPLTQPRRPWLMVRARFLDVSAFLQQRSLASYLEIASSTGGLLMQARSRRWLRRGYEHSMQARVSRLIRVW